MVILSPLEEIIMAWELRTLRSKTKMRENVVEAVNKQRVPKDKIIVVGGAALQVFGIKKSEDIDLVTEPRLFNKLLGETGSTGRLHLGHVGLATAVVKENDGQHVYDEGYGVTLGDVTYMPAPDDHLYRATFEELYDEALDIDGILVSPPERILEWKQGVDRPKDREDIRLIEKYLARQSQSA